MNRIMATSITHDLFQQALQKFEALIELGYHKESEFDAFIAGSSFATAYFLRFLKFPVGNDTQMGLFITDIMKQAIEFHNSMRKKPEEN